MSHQEHARSIVAEWRKAPPPKAGVNDPDSILVRLIAEALGAMGGERDVVIERTETESRELSRVRLENDALREKKIGVERKMESLADRLEGESFGAGLATPADLYAVAKEIREIARTT